MDKTINYPRLKRWGSSKPITEEVLLWSDMAEAASYFGEQGLSDIAVLHQLEIESCVKLMSKLKISKSEFVDYIHKELE